MVGSLAALVLALSVAQAEPDHHMYQPAQPETVGFPNWVVTPTGRDRLFAKLQANAEEIAKKEEEAALLREKVKELAATPELTWQGVVVVAALALATGLVVGIPLGVGIGRK